VVPVTSGDGLIPGFSEAVAAILNHIGVKCRITVQSDVAGFGEAFSTGVDVLFAADDRKFFAFNLKSLVVADNSRATAAGFVHALAAAAAKRNGTVKGQRVLVMGLGPVGLHSVNELKKFGARVLVFDTDNEKMSGFVREHAVRAVGSIREGMLEADYVIDATPSDAIINEELIRPGTVISCPGVPQGLTPKALNKIGANFIHDKLPLGVAVMAVQSIFGDSGQ